MDSWDYPHSPIGARVFLGAGVRHGLTPGQCLAGTGLSPQALETAETIEAGQEVRVARNLQRLLGDVPGLGAEAGRLCTLTGLGMWGFALLSSPTWGDALAVGTRYIRLSAAFVRLDVREEAGETRLLLYDEHLPEDVRDLLVERDLAAIAALLPALAGPVTGHRLETRLAPARAAGLAKIFSGRILPGRPRHVLACPTALMSTPLPQADGPTWRACVERCQDLLERRHAGEGTAARVRALLLARRGEPASMARVAAALNTEVRTLHRRLAAEGTSFRALRDEVHASLAIELLGTVGLTVAEVARRLGYADPTSFHHAFKRWTGRAPSDYKAVQATGVTRL